MRKVGNFRNVVCFNRSHVTRSFRHTPAPQTFTIPAPCSADPSDQRLLACWDWGSESRRRNGCLSLVNVVSCQVEISAWGGSLVQRSLTEFGVSECDGNASTMKGLWPTKGCRAMGGEWDSIQQCCLRSC